MSRTALAFAGVAMVAWGLWAVFAKYAARSLAPEVAMILSYAAGIGVAFVYLFSQDATPTLSTVGVGYAVAGGLFSGIGAISYYVSLRQGTASIATTVTALYFVVAALIGIVFLGESVSIRDVAAIGLAVGAVVLFST